jgi:hypothetical protein
MLTRILLALLAALSLACAHTPQAKATQKTAVGGGFIAIGAAGATTTVVGAGLAFAVLSNQGTLDSTTTTTLAASAGTGLLISGLWTVVGFAVMLGAQEELEGAAPPPRTAPRVEAPRRRVVDDAPRRPPPKWKAFGRVAVLLSDPPLLRLDGVDVDDCENAKLVVDGVDFDVIARGDGYAVRDGIPIERAKWVTLSACGETADLSDEARAFLVSAP